jgi:hypothetical protein
MKLYFHADRVEPDGSTPAGESASNNLGTGLGISIDTR